MSLAPTKLSAWLTIALAALILLAPQAALAATRHTDGTIVRNGSEFYKIENKHRIIFSSADIYHSQGYEFWQGLQATDGDMDLPTICCVDWADGTLVNDRGTIYVVNQGTKRGFSTWESFLRLGYNPASVYAGQTYWLKEAAPITSLTNVHPAGTLVVRDGDVWQIQKKGRALVPSMEVFDSYGWKWANVVPATDADMSLSVLKQIKARDNGGKLRR